MDIQSFLLGMMVAWTPSLIVLSVLLPRDDSTAIHEANS
jgi:hypothetical protein